MQMYQVQAVNQNMEEVLLQKIFFAQDEEDALDQMEEVCKEQDIPYAFCLAEEI